VVEGERRRERNGEESRSRPEAANQPH